MHIKIHLIPNQKTCMQTEYKQAFLALVSGSNVWTSVPTVQLIVEITRSTDLPTHFNIISKLMNFYASRFQSKELIS